ncbi:MAG: hypothetical protein AAB337_02295 [Patescibacteria group bacterium]
MAKEAFMTRLTASGFTHWFNITAIFWNLLISASWNGKLNWKDAPKTQKEMGWRFVLTTEEGSTFTFTRIPFFGYWVKAEIIRGARSTMEHSMFFELMVNPKELERNTWASATDMLLAHMDGQPI